MSKTILTEKEIATLVDGDLFISTGAKIAGINSLNEATADEISFLGNEKYYNDFLNTKAGIILAPKALTEAPAGIAIIHVPNPSLSFATIAEHLATDTQQVDYKVSTNTNIAPSATFPTGKVAIMAGAFVGENSTLAEGVVLHPGVVIGNNVTIGADTIIYPNCVIRENCQIGARVILQPGCIIGSDGYGFELSDGEHKKIAQIGTVIIEDDVEIGANSTVDRARFGKTTIKKGTKIDNLVQIAHNVTIGEHNLLVAQSAVAGSTETAEYVTIGPQSGVAGHLKIGTGVVLVSQSGFAKSVPNAGYYQGSPARPIQDTRKSRAITNRLPKLLDRIDTLEQRLAKLENQ